MVQPSHFTRGEIAPERAEKDLLKLQCLLDRLEVVFPDQWCRVCKRLNISRIIFIIAYMCKGFHCSVKGSHIHYLYYFEILNLRGPPRGSKGKYYYSHFTDEDSETQRSHKIFPVSHSMQQTQNTNPGF